MKVLKEHIIRAFGIGIPLSILIAFGNFIGQQGMPSFEEILTQFIINLWFSITLYGVNAYGFFLLEKMVKGWENPLRKFAIGLLISALFSFIVIFINVIFVMFGVLGDFPKVFKWIFSISSYSWVWFSLILSIVIFSIFFGIHYYRIKNAKKLEEKDYELKTVSTSQEAIKDQIGAHFLFNSLSVLGGMIDENQTKSKEYVNALANVYRYVLDKKEKELITLAEEISFAENYLELVKLRFEDGLNFQIDIPEQYMNLMLPPLSLQVLLENIVKHNKISSKSPIEIIIKAADGSISIENQKNLKKVLENHPSTGLKTLQERFSLFTRQPLEITDNHELFKVKIPLLTQNQNKMQVEHQVTELEYYEARKRVEEKQGFFWNLASYVIVNGFLIFLWSKNGGYFWPMWPMIGWGIGLAFHFVGVFGFFESQSWKEKQIQKELEKIRKEKNKFS